MTAQIGNFLIIIMTFTRSSSFFPGKVTYHIEGKAYHLKPRDILLVSQGAIHKPEIDPSVPYERYIFWIRDDLSMQELNTCFQKATDHSFNLVGIDSWAVQGNISVILLRVTLKIP